MNGMKGMNEFAMNVNMFSMFEHTLSYTLSILLLMDFVPIGKLLFHCSFQVVVDENI